MKQWLLAIIFMTVAGLLAACSAEASQPEPAQAKPVQSESAQTETTQTESVQAESAQAESVQSETAPVESAQAESAQAESAQTESVQSETAQSEAAQVDEPAQAVPAQLAMLTFTTQSNNESAVGVDVTPLNLAAGEETVDFEVAFNTHSVDLSFDPTTISVLRDGAGNEYPAIAWEGSATGGHHRSGVLQFEAPDLATDFVEVVMHDVAGVPERVFHWDLAQ